MLEAPVFALAKDGVEPQVEGRFLFESISELGHAIVGTTSLVGADSLTDSARALEDLALRGHEALLELDRCLSKARRAAELCSEGARRMRGMLDLELGKRSSEAGQALTRGKGQAGVRGAWEGRSA